MILGRTRQALIATGAALLVASVLIPAIIWGLRPGGLEDIAFAIIATIILAPLFFFTGLIILFAGIAKSGGQQQQQQVVMLDPEQARAQGFTSGESCPQCNEDLGGDEAYCIGCGVKLARA